MLANFLAAGDGNSLDPIAHMIEKDRLFDQVLPEWLWQDWSQGGLGISKPVIYMFIAGLLCCAVFIPMARKWSAVPRGMQKWMEPLLLFVRNVIVYEAIHPKELADKLVPFFWTLFFWILFMNVLGLTPYSIASTGQLSVTAGLAVISAVMIVGLLLVAIVVDIIAAVVLFAPVAIMIVLMSMALGSHWTTVRRRGGRREISTIPVPRRPF